MAIEGRSDRKALQVGYGHDVSTDEICKKKNSSHDLNFTMYVRDVHTSAIYSSFMSLSLQFTLAS